MASPIYDITPSGVPSMGYCVHPVGEVVNIIKHIPFEVASAIRDCLNASEAHAEMRPLVRFILYSQGTVFGKEAADKLHG